VDLLCCLSYATNPQVSGVLALFQRQQRQMEHAQSTWWDLMSQLQTTLRYGALQLFNNCQLSRDQLHNYLISGQSWNLRNTHRRRHATCLVLASLKYAISDQIYKCILSLSINLRRNRMTSQKFRVIRSMHFIFNVTCDFKFYYICVIRTIK